MFIRLIFMILAVGLVLVLISGKFSGGGGGSDKGIFGLRAGMPLYEVPIVGVIKGAYVLQSVPQPMDGFNRYTVSDTNSGICQVVAHGSFQIESSTGTKGQLLIKALRGKYGDFKSRGAEHTWSFKEGRADNIVRITLIFSSDDPIRQSWQMRLTEDFGGPCR